MSGTIPNDLEFAILQEIFEANQEEYPDLQHHFDLLRVSNRELTGVGMYVYFLYDNTLEEHVRSQLKDGIISANKLLEINALKNGLGFVLDITAGKINYLEMFTYGSEMWNGEYNSFSFSGI